MIQELQELHSYNRWANGRMLDAVATLDEPLLSEDLGSSFPTLLETLAHMLTSEWAWLSRWQGVSPGAAPETWDLSSLEGLREQWEEVERDLAEFVAGLTEDSVQEVIQYRNWRGERFSQPLSHMLRHVVNHASYHRGQVTTLLRQLGGEPVPTDLILFYRERLPREAHASSGG